MLLLLASVSAFGQTAPVPIPIPIPIATSPAEPSQFFSTGGGIAGLGPSQVFGYYSMSQCLSLDKGKCAAYSTEITEFQRLKGGKVGTCARVGISKSLWAFGPVLIGIVGDAGACEGQTGSASGAMSARTFLAVRVGRTPIYFIGTAQDLKTAGVGSQTTITLGIGYGLFK